MTLFGTVEMGGTKTDLAVGTSYEDMSERHRVSTTTPEETLDAVVGFLRSHDVGAVGVASFGPLDLDPSSDTFGSLLATPKPGWSGYPIYETLTRGVSAPAAVNTDVNGAALGEGRWGAATGMTDYVYLTVGTGVGAGIVVNGDLVRDGRHPEAGHVIVKRRRDDSHEGSCPYHGDCLEGMTAGPALEARFGRPETWAGNDAVLDLATDYLAQGLCDLVYTVVPERIIVGGGVSSLPHFHERLRSRLHDLMGHYPRDPDLDLLVSKPGLGTLSGLAGGLVLAERAVRAPGPSQSP